MIMTQLVFLGLTLWLAGYMVARDVQTMPLRLTALGMGVYTIVLANGLELPACSDEWLELYRWLGIQRGAPRCAPDSFHEPIPPESF